MRQQPGQSHVRSLPALVGALLALAGFCLPWVISPVYPDLYSFTLLDRLLGIRPQGARFTLEWAFVLALFAIMFALFAQVLLWILRHRLMFSPAVAIVLTLIAVAAVSLLDFTWFNPAAPLFAFPYAPKSPGVGQLISALGTGLILLGNGLALRADRSERAGVARP